MRHVGLGLLAVAAMADVMKRQTVGLLSDEELAERLPNTWNDSRNRYSEAELAARERIATKKKERDDAAIAKAEAKRARKLAKRVEIMKRDVSRKPSIT